MTPEKDISSTKLCPVCGTRLSEKATRCLVCGTELDQSIERSKASEIRAKRLPEVTLSLPAILGILVLFLSLAAVVVFLAISNNAKQQQADDILIMVIEGTATASPTITETPTITWTPTEAPTWTPLPPIDYVVKPGESCAGIAAAFNISVQSIILENNLPANCELYENQELKIPQPTPTASPQPTATLSEIEQTEATCETVSYTVQENDTLSSIANTYNVAMATIREYNGLLSDTVYSGQNLTIPLCLRRPTPGPTPTPTQLPPYPAPNLLLPSDGASFTSASDIITLQWAAVGALEPNEAYEVTIVDLTSEDKLSITEYVRDTSYIIPTSFAPPAGKPHIFRWSINIVRQIGGNEEDGENWEIAGHRSDQRVFAWMSSAIGP
jgi:LysM repeat protein/ribosomal protein L40E